MRLIALLLLLPCVGFGQSWIDSLIIIPPNPDTSDIIEVVSYTTFSYSSCTLDSSEIILGPSEITIDACYTIGIGAAFCNSIDTITIGVLAPGNYVLIYNVKEYCIAVNVSDSVNFNVVAFNSLPELASFEQVNVYPNPTTGTFTVQGATGTIVVLDLFGRLVHSSTDPQLDMSNFPKGVYLVKVGDAVRKLILH